MRKKDDWQIRIWNIWTDASTINKPIGKLFTDLSFCRWHPNPLDSFESKEKEILLMISDARNQINTYAPKENANATSTQD